MDITTVVKLLTLALIMLKKIGVTVVAIWPEAQKTCFAHLTEIIIQKSQFCLFGLNNIKTKSIDVNLTIHLEMTKTMT